MESFVPELPQKRHLEHLIILKDNIPPISARPYRCPHFQKDEIERLITKMLIAWVIQVSYTVPVILVKKKRMGHGGSVSITVNY